MTTRRFGPYSVTLEREEKVLFPGEEITKGALIRYYDDVANVILPHLRDRPLTLQRFPDGIEKEGFYQKEAPDYFPDWISRAPVPLAGEGSQEQVLAGNRATLVYLANQATITPHVWLSRLDEPDTPDRMVFDLDPAGDDFTLVRAAARALNRILDAVGLTPFFMTTGSDGGHVWVPLRRKTGFDEVRAFARTVAECLAQANPERFTTRPRKGARKGRLYLDVGRNARGQTAVAPYAVRARPGAPVATPLAWEELDRKGLDSRTFNLRSIPRRLGQQPDPWKGMGRRAGSLSRARERWKELDEEVCHA